MQTKKLFLVLLIGALLLAGLFFIMGKKSSEATTLLKPSQMDFTNSNQLQEPMKFEEQSQAEPTNVESVSATVFAPPTTLSESEQKLWTTLEEILKSKNDNDPLVNQIKNLSADFRKALSDKYSSLKAEDRNGRGFIIFLISKDLKSASDLDFLQKVYQEQPCLSLENCSTTSRDENPHTSGTDQTTMNYPQLVALYQIDKQLAVKPELLNDPAMRAGILATLKQAEAFPVPAVHDRAAQIRQKHNL